MPPELVDVPPGCTSWRLRCRASGHWTVALRFSDRVEWRYAATASKGAVRPGPIIGCNLAGRQQALGVTPGGIQATVPVARCHACHARLPLSQFAEDRTRSSGVSSRCRMCQTAYMRHRRRTQTVRLPLDLRRRRVG